MCLFLHLLIEFSIALVTISSAAASEPAFLDDKPRTIASNELNGYDQSLEMFTDWNKPVPDTGSTLAAMSAFNPNDDLCPSDMSNKLPSDGRIRARGDAAACETRPTIPDGTAHQDGSQEHQPIIRPGSSGGTDEEEEENNNSNNGKESSSQEHPISPNKEPGTNSNGNGDNVPPTTYSGKGPNDECSEFLGGVFMWVVCDSGRGPDFYDILRRPERLLPGRMTFQLTDCFPGTVSSSLFSWPFKFTK